MILAFDPGVTTGVAVVDNGEIIYTAALGTVDGMVTRNLAKRFPGAEVVAEAPPLMGGNYRPHTQSVEEAIKKQFPDAYWVNPGQWKGTPPSRTPVPKSLTQHEKDAVHLAFWFKANRSRLAGNQRVS